MRACVFAFACVLATLAAAADLKITTTHTGPDGFVSGPITRYWSGQRSRMDWRNTAAWGNPAATIYGPRQAVIYQCDEHRVLELDFDRQQYTSVDLDQNGNPAPSEASADLPAPPRRSGARVVVQVETRDTGERRSMFGLTAHHYVVTRKIQPESGACVPPGEEVADGWYVPFEPPPDSCRTQQPAHPHTVAVLATVGCLDNYDVHASGPDPGFPLDVTYTSIDESSGPRAVRRSSSRTSVTEFSQAALDPDIFELPVGFLRVDRLDTKPSVPLMLRWRMRWESVKRAAGRLWPW